MFSAWPANAMGLRALQQYILDAMHWATHECWTSTHDLRMGPLIIVSQSAHIWRLFWERWQADSTSVHQKSASNGITLILQAISRSVQDDKIVVEHTTPLEVINCYSGKSASQHRQIAADCPKLNTQYLGTELQKQKFVSKQQGFVYEQDKLLGTIATAVKPQIWLYAAKVDLSKGHHLGLKWYLPRLA